jgi:hypothetical protein
MVARRFVAVAFALAAAACTHVQYRDTNPAPRPMATKDPNAVEVYTLGPPQRPFVEVGFIDTRAGGFLSTDPFFALREEAGRRGCDALVLIGSNDRTVSDPINHSVNTRQGYRAACIVWNYYAATATASPSGAHRP